jgi:hypothetical protein
VRPGLCSGGAKRELEIHKKKKANQPVPVAVKEEEARSEGLSTALDEKNKGFRLLQKCLSKQNTGIFDAAINKRKPDATLTPIPLIIKKSRSGLREGDSKPVHSAGQHSAVEKLTDEKLSEFRTNQQDNVSVRHLVYDIKTSQKVCYNLDSEAGITEPEYDFLWPPHVIESMKEKTDDQQNVRNSETQQPDSPDEMQNKLQQITDRLRTKYFFCIWCGIRFESESDLTRECPGDTRALHD